MYPGIECSLSNGSAAPMEDRMSMHDPSSIEQLVVEAAARWVDHCALIFGERCWTQQGRGCARGDRPRRGRATDQRQFCRQRLANYKVPRQ
ncbi:MAG: hypothetical protein LC748_05110 [Thermomicrobia bacterium]|nr:hypothetical protein [Thermomicrobia bacterium]